MDILHSSTAWCISLLSLPSKIWIWTALYRTQILAKEANRNCRNDDDDDSTDRYFKFVVVLKILNNGMMDANIPRQAIMYVTTLDANRLPYRTGTVFTPVCLSSS